MKKRLISALPEAKSQGFSIIEFIVASTLSAIVLMAVGSGYFTARTLNQTALSRVSVQQDLRNAANLMVRDARMAGNFGCFNMSEFASANVITDSGNPLTSLKTSGHTNLIPVRESTGLNISGFNQSGTALIFQYGTDKSDAESATAIVSSCTAIAKPGKAIGNLADAKKELKIAADAQDGSISIQKHEVRAYATGTVGNEQGLFLFSLKDNGQWSNPQLLIRGVNNMNIHYIYAKNCPQEATAAGATFSDAASLSAEADAKTPAMVRISLNNGSISASNDNNVDTYRINASIRGGYSCANTSL